MFLDPGPPLRSYLMGQFDPADYAAFKVLSGGTQEASYFLLQEVAEAYQAMHRAAFEAGLTLCLVSAFRSFARQKVIWERKWLGKHLNSLLELSAWQSMPPAARVQKILNYTAAPGCSRHHWGTDLDLCSVAPEYFQTSPGHEIQIWLRQHASQFGFFEVYSEGRVSGHDAEPWHFSYLPLSNQVLQAFKENVTLQHLPDFSGSHLLPTNYLEVYMAEFNHD